MRREHDENLHTTSICNEFLHLFLHLYICHAEIDDTARLDAYKRDFDTYLGFVSCLLPNLRVVDYTGKGNGNREKS